jgi:hypothetical protein
MDKGLNRHFIEEDGKIANMNVKIHSTSLNIREVPHTIRYLLMLLMLLVLKSTSYH